MSDIAHTFDGETMQGDISFNGQLLDTDEGLYTAILHSLFTDARAGEDDALPWGDEDQRGWWGDALPQVEGDRYGSKLWLIRREKQLPEVLARSKEFADEALAWLVTDGVVGSVEVETEFIRPGMLGILITITRLDGENETYTFDYGWSNS